MQTKRRQTGDITVLDLAGKITLAEGDKLISVFEIVSSEDIPHLTSGRRMIAECPVCDPPTPFALGSDATFHQDLEPCRACGTRLIVADSSWPPAPGHKTLHCVGLRMPTYEGEHVDFYVTTHQRITIEHRLDLFVSELVERLWQILPAPRRVVFTVGYDNATDAGLEKLVNLCMRTHDGSRAAIVVGGTPEIRRDEFARSGVIFGDQSRAVEAVGTGEPQQLRLSVTIRRE